jgi:hypothetical protein
MRLNCSRNKQVPVLMGDATRNTVPDNMAYSLLELILPAVLHKAFYPNEEWS